MSAITTAAFAAQQHVDVESIGGSEPCSIFSITLGRSGERKTTVANIYLKKMRAHEDEIRIERETEKRGWDVAKLDVDARVAKLRRGSPNSPERAEYDRQRNEAQTDLGSKPWGSGGVVSTATIEGVYSYLSSWRPSMMIETSEASGFFGGYSMRDESLFQSLSMYTQFWDGVPVQKALARSSNEALSGRRISMQLSGQPEVVIPSLQRKELMDQGFFARLLLSYPPSMQGRRTNTIEHSELPFTNALTDRFLWAYKNEAIAFDDSFIIRNPVMPWSVEAIEARKAEDARIEKMLDANGGELAPYSALGNRIIPNASRLATIFAFFDTAHENVGSGLQSMPIGQIHLGEISLEHWKAGLAVSWYSAKQWISLLGGMTATSLTRDGQKVLDQMRNEVLRAVANPSAQPAIRRGEFSFKALLKREMYRGLSGSNGDAAKGYLRDEIMPYLVERGQVHARSIRGGEAWVMDQDCPP